MEGTISFDKLQHLMLELPTSYRKHCMQQHKKKSWKSNIYPCNRLDQLEELTNFLLRIWLIILRLDYHIRLSFNNLQISMLTWSVIDMW